MKPKSTLAKPAFPYTGGKGKLLAQLLPHVPKHTVYCEPFAGGLALLCAKARAKVEVVNDANRDLVTLYRYVRYHNDALRGELANLLHSRADFEAFSDSVPMTDLQRALRWYFLQVASFGGKGHAFGRSRTDWHGFRATNHLERIAALRQRLEGVTIECGDWRKIVEWYDGPETFFFFDPPYIGCADTAYAAWTEHELQSLRNALDKVKGTWMLTINDAPVTRAIFNGLARQQLSIRYSLGSRMVKEAKVSGELLIFSPRLRAANVQRLAA